MTLEPSEEPLYDPKEIYGVIPQDTRKPYDVREVIARIVDGSRFDEFKARYGSTLVTGFARLYGMPVGIVANNGILFGESAQKGAHFIELCCAARRAAAVPAEHHRLHGRHASTRTPASPRDGAKMVTAVATAQVPKFTMLIGGRFGAGNYGMCGRAYSPRFLWMWPNARISVMGGEQAAGGARDRQARRHRGARRRVVGRGGARLQGADPRAVRAPGPSRTTRPRGCGTTASIDPAQTRRVLGLSLSATLNAPIPATKFGVFRM